MIVLIEIFSMAKVSIIIPVFNVEEYLAKCLDSLIVQTLGDIEIILVDDGSTDGSLSVCHAYSQKDERIIVLHKKNGGVASARNLGLSIANGEFIGFVDPDDYVDPDMFEVLYSLCIDNDAMISCCNAYGQTVKLDKKHKDHIILLSTDELFIKTMKECSFGLWDKLWHKSLFLNFEFPEDIETGSDLVTYHLVFNSNVVVYINDSKYHYLTREGSLCRTTSLTNRRNRLKILDEMMDYLKNNRPHLLQYGFLLSSNTRLGFIRYLIVLNNTEIMNEQFKMLKHDFYLSNTIQPLSKKLLFKFVLTYPNIYALWYRAKVKWLKK